MSELPVMFTVPQVCRILQMSRSKVYNLLASGELLSVKVGRSRRIPQRFLDHYVEALCKTTASPQ